MLNSGQIGAQGGCDPKVWTLNQSSVQVILQDSDSTILITPCLRCYTYR